MQHDRSYLIRLAEKNVCDGIIEEPRFFYDSIGVSPTTGIITDGNEDVFRNGEQFPVRLTHLIAAIRGDQEEIIDERMIQRVGIRFLFHDQYYMNPEFVSLPLWANKPIAAGDTTTVATASWFFDRPVILSARDSLRVTVALEFGVTREVAVCFTGVGIQSKRPYFLSASVLAETTPTVLPTDRYRNDGAEPIALTDMTVFCGTDNASDPQGDIRRLRLNIRQIGNGTNADWGTGPVGPTLILPECPAVLFGVTTGRAVVHRFPGDGLIWEPGEGITMQTRQMFSGAVPANTNLAIGLFGYISVT